MNCLKLLGLSAGVTFFVGSGGKTTLLRAVAEEARDAGRSAILATTTHFHPFPGIETVPTGRMADVARALARDGIACVAAPARGKAGIEGKLGPSPLPLADLALAADLVLVEADGSKHLPLKAHAAHEPVVPAARGSRRPQTIMLVGASGFGRPIAKAAHRPQLFCERTGAAPDDTAAPELVARLIAWEMGAGIVCPDAVVVSQVRGKRDGERAGSFARSLADQGIHLPVFVFDLRREMHRVM